MHQLPLLTERQYIAAIHTRLQDARPWKLPGLQGTVRLAWALALRGISQFTDVTGNLIHRQETQSHLFPLLSRGSQSIMHIPLFKLPTLKYAAYEMYAQLVAL